MAGSVLKHCIGSASFLMPSRIPFSNLISIQFLPQVFHILENQYFVYIVFIVLSILSSSFNFQFFCSTVYLKCSGES